ncbi:MAG: OmpA family protein [Myxococcales bacterium]
MMISSSKKVYFLIAIAALGMPSIGFAGSDRDATIEQLDTILANEGDDSVRVLVNDGEGAPVRIGDELVYHFESSSPGYLTAVHVDTQGAATLLYPRVDVEEGRVHAGQAVQLPALTDGFQFSVQPPVGRDLVYAIVTKVPITRQDLEIESRDVVVSFESHQAPGLVRLLSKVLNSRASKEIHVASVAQQIDGRGSVQYRSLDIVSFFGERTRSIRPAKLDLQIQFATNSAELDAASRRNIDEFAQALKDPKLRSMKFRVAGHTDVRGSEQHNLGLSGRRAETVRSYLIRSGGIDESRLEIQALGETTPLMQEDSAYARQMNRRVEFTPVR